MRAEVPDEQGLLTVDVTAADEATLREFTDALGAMWASSIGTVARRVPGQAGVSGRVYVDLRRPVGRRRELPAEWIRLAAPPWGGRLPETKPKCVRARADGRSCTRQAAEWPPGFVDDVDPGACWSHLTDAERLVCERARRLYRDAFWDLHAVHRQQAGHSREERCAACAGNPAAGAWD
ncbi:DUF6207 family protein [Streptomyces sp. NPDC087297]|uniref:DUF6207 family protein n=1 Tax=Streptomyces sp. NPDC087297 TaxID=3365778 RepID=UPI0037FDA1A4